MDKAFYLEALYPFQDQVLRVLNEVETGFYLSWRSDSWPICRHWGRR